MKSAQRVGGSTSVRFSTFAICTIFISTASRLLLSATSKVRYLLLGGVAMTLPSTSTTYRWHLAHAQLLVALADHVVVVEDVQLVLAPVPVVLVLVEEHAATREAVLWQQGVLQREHGQQADDDVLVVGVGRK